MARVISLGSICSGSTLNEDILPALSDRLREITGGCPLCEEVDAIEDWDEVEPETASDLMDKLESALSNYAPPYTYFGTSEGDGTDYGFWIDTRRIAEDREDETLPSGDELPETDRVGDEGEGDLFLHVSDHGNMELYQWAEDKVTRRYGWVSLWSCV